MHVNLSYCFTFSVILRCPMKTDFTVKHHPGLCLHTDHLANMINWPDCGLCYWTCLGCGGDVTPGAIT